MTPALTSLDALQRGLSLGRYQCLIPIARGGMAAVWAARAKGARGFEKMVALKTMLPSLSEDPSFTHMFLEEARIASHIRHPNVVEVIDLGEEGELLYLVMEWIDGEPLSAVVREALRTPEGVPLDIAARIVIDACAGLHAAHELCDRDGLPLGLVHRDVSPQNILLSMSGLVKLVDFGIAKIAGRATYETAPGQLRGKIGYMAPEQALGKGIDRRSDVFAMGTVLYLLVTGKHPFRGDSDMETLQNIVLRPAPRPGAVAAPKLVDPAIEEVILRALSRDPDNRYATAADLAAALETALGSVAPASTEALAAFLEKLVGARARERREALKRASLEADDPAGAGGTVDTPVVSGGVTAGWQISKSLRRAALSEADIPALHGADRRRGRRWPLVVGAGLLLLAGVGLGVSIGGRRGDAPAASVSTTTAQEPSASATVEAAAPSEATPAPPPSSSVLSAEASADRPGARARPPRPPPPRTKPPRSSQPIPNPGF